MIAVLNKNKVHISKQEINLGKLPTFITNDDGEYVLDAKHRRIISFREDRVEPEFPLIVCTSRIRESLEMNLFLMHRATGKYAVSQNKKQQDSMGVSSSYLASLHGEAVDMKYVLSLAKDLRDFLEFLVDKTFSYEHVLAAPLAKDSVNDDIAALPIWKYQQYLIKRVETPKGYKGQLAYSTANRRIGTIRHFYQWSYKRGCIDHLPFSLKYKALQRKSKDRASSLFAMPTPYSPTKYGQWVTNLSIPKTAQQKSDAPTQLQPYSPSELVQLLDSYTAKHRTYGLFFKCAYLGGLRDFEVPQIDSKAIFNPAKNLHNGVRKTYIISLIRKGKKPINLPITSGLMQALYDYTLDPVWEKRSLKHETKYGINNPEEPKPLFLNRNGERMAEAGCGTAIRQVRREQREKNIPVLQRDYHDLRATFGTYIAMQMVLAGVPEARIKSTMLKLFSHERFSTSEDYLDFAKALLNTSVHGEMSVWVNDMYAKVLEMIKPLITSKKDEDTQ